MQNKILDCGEINIVQCKDPDIMYPCQALTFKNRASYIQDRRTATLQMLHFIYFFQQM
jgi:hypothetical protein